MRDLVYTIGHSTHAIERLVELLAAHAVTAVADVRSQPFSRFNPQFNREALKASLSAAGVGYVFLGRELGARTEDRECYVDGRAKYERIAQTSLFQEGLARVAAGAGGHRVALLCAERDPLVCHRAILVCRHLIAAHGIAVEHIREDGRIETHDDALTRLLEETGISGGELFRSRDERIAEAYARRAAEIEYKERQREPLGGPDSDESKGQ